MSTESTVVLWSPPMETAVVRGGLCSEKAIHFYSIARANESDKFYFLHLCFPTKSLQTHSPLTRKEQTTISLGG